MTKIDQISLDGIPRIHKHVIRVDISVHELFIMQVNERSQKLVKN